MMTLKQRLEQMQARGRAIALNVSCSMKKQRSKTTEIYWRDNILSVTLYRNGKECMFISEKNVSKELYRYVIQRVSSVYEFTVEKEEEDKYLVISA